MRKFKDLSGLEKRAHWKTCQREMREIIRHSDLQKRGLNLDIASEYVNHNENGLALETVEYLIEKNDIEIGPDLLSRINALREKMGYPNLDNLGV